MVLGKDRFLYLDALRGIAATSVVFCHFFSGYNDEFGHSFWFPSFFKFGYYGVELFFLISGFVIFYTLSKTASIKEFLIKRAIRLYPTYWICLAITFCLLKVFPLDSFRNVTIKEMLFSLTMFNGLFKVKAVDPSYWTLLVEWFFYIMIASTIYISRYLKRDYYYFFWFWLALILFYNFIYKIPIVGAFFNLRYGSFFVSGICFYEIYISKKQVTQYWFLLLFSFLVSFFAITDMEDSYVAITILYILFLVVLHFKFSFLSNRTFVFLCEISYALYLIHQNVGFIIMRKLELVGLTSIWKVVVAILIVIGLATFITRKLEKPISIMLKRLLNV